MTKSIFEVSRAATRVVFAAQLATQIIAVLSLAILYRLLQPADFGLLGMAVPLVMLPRMLANSGIHAAAVQQSRLSSEQLSSLFWWNLSAGCVAAAMTAAGAVPLAAIYKVAELAEIGWWLAGTSILAAVVSQYQTRLERELRIGRVAVSRLAAMVAGCLTAVAAAQANFGVWALVMQMYAELFFLSVFLFAAGWWIPNWPWQGQSVRGLLRFGGYYSLSGLLFYVAQNADKVILAVAIGSTRTGQAFIGMYTQAYNLMMKPVYFVSAPLSSVMLPILSQAHSHTQAADRTAVETLAVGYFRLVSILLMPCAAGLFATAPDVMLLLGGESWFDAGWMLMAFAPAALIHGHYNVMGSMFAAAGRADRLLFGAALSCLLMIQGYFAAVLFSESPRTIVLAMAASYTLMLVVVLFVPYLSFCATTTGVKPLRLLGQMGRPFSRAAIMGAVVWSARQVLLATNLAATPRVTILVILGLVLYGALAFPDLRWACRELGPTASKSLPDL